MADCWEVVDRAKDVRFVEWDDCSMDIVCGCGQPDIVVDSVSTAKICRKCGKKFRLFVQLQVWRERRSEP